MFKIFFGTLYLLDMKMKANYDKNYMIEEKDMTMEFRKI